MRYTYHWFLVVNLGFWGVKPLSCIWKLITRLWFPDSWIIPSAAPHGVPCESGGGKQDTSKGRRHPDGFHHVFPVDLALV